MPVIDGIKLCKLVKENLSTRHIPVYILSTKTDIESQLESFRVGADDYIIKPFSINILKFKTLNMLHTSHYIFEHSSNIMPTERINTTMNKEILEKANMVVEKNIDNMKFSIKQFAWEMNMSCSSLHMKLKAITGESTTEFIHKIRLNRACQLLEEGKFSISEISFMVGYNTPSYFTTCFKKYVGCLPIEYKNRFFPV
ncbi:response regulator transcription factor [Bacteroides thetaiotaomicron]|nr:DNA-binding response regulator [Bacteroides thetaiotaomicron]MCS2716931.1 DNA-binding response regulator [Bacteroides thetaiotaomicron]MCS2900235.1 DNA-binding response regulator [Bacteroides thetaiotaomicron]